MTRFSSGFKNNLGLKPNLKPDQINWVLEDYFVFPDLLDSQEKSCVYRYTYNVAFR